MTTDSCLYCRRRFVVGDRIYSNPAGARYCAPPAGTPAPSVCVMACRDTVMVKTWTKEDAERARRDKR